MSKTKSLPNPCNNCWKEPVNKYGYFFCSCYPNKSYTLEAWNQHNPELLSDEEKFRDVTDEQLFNELTRRVHNFVFYGFREQTHVWFVAGPIPTLLGLCELAKRKLYQVLDEQTGE